MCCDPKGERCKGPDDPGHADWITEFRSAAGISGAEYPEDDRSYGRK